MNDSDQFQLSEDNLHFINMERQMAFTRKKLCSQVIKVLLSTGLEDEDALIQVCILKWQTLQYPVGSDFFIAAIILILFPNCTVGGERNNSKWRNDT